MTVMQEATGTTHDIEEFREVLKRYGFTPDAGRQYPNAEEWSRHRFGMHITVRVWRPEAFNCEPGPWRYLLMIEAHGQDTASLERLLQTPA